MRVFKKEVVRALCLVKIIALTFVSPLGAEQFSISKSSKTLADIENHYDGRKVQIQPQLNALSGGFISCGQTSLYYTKSMNSIFYEDKMVEAKIIYVDATDDSIKVELRSVDGRIGWVNFHIHDLGNGEFSEDNLNCFIESSLSGEGIQKVYFDKKKKVFHLFTNNHFTENLVTFNHAISKGAKPDHLCFAQRLYLPASEREQEISREILGSVLQLGPISNNDSEHVKLSILGEKILDNWPIRRIGFNYRFYVIESDVINALAVPGGQIFVTRGLLNLVENDLELEAVLAHEIAHVEKRHSIRSMEIAMNQIREQQAAGQFAVVAAALGATSSSNNNEGIYRIAAALSLAAIASYAFSENYPYEQEQEADFLANLYFKKSNLDISALHSLFRKLQFINLTSINNPDPVSNFHPRFVDRISYSQPGNFEIYDDYKLAPKDANLQRMFIQPLYFVKKAGGGSYLYVYLNDRDLYEKETRPEVGKLDTSRSEEITIHAGGKGYSLKIVEESKTRSQFGEFWLLKSEARIQDGLANIEMMDIEVTHKQGRSNKVEIRFSQSKGQ